MKSKQSRRMLTFDKKMILPGISAGLVVSLLEQVGSSLLALLGL